MNLPTAYIIGKVGDVSDRDYYEWVCKKFAVRAESLKIMGYIPLNPMAIVPPDATWEEAMTICLPIVASCDYISPLPDTWWSRGGMIEFNYARSLHKPIVLPRIETKIELYENNL